MKLCIAPTLRIRLTVLTAGIVLCTLTTSPARSQVDSTANANQQKARAALQSAVRALGGDAWLHARFSEQDGRSAHFYLGKPTGETVDYWAFYRYGTNPKDDEERIEFFKKRDVAQIFLPAGAWEITYRGKTALPEKQQQDYSRARAHSIEALLKDWIDRPDIVLIHEGQTMVERHLAEKVSMITAENDAVTLELDANTHLPLRRTYQWRDPTYHDKNEEEDEYDDYHLYDGVQTPFALTHFRNGDMTNQRFLSRVSYNHPVDAAMFNPDETAKKLRH